MSTSAVPINSGHIKVYCRIRPKLSDEHESVAMSINSVNEGDEIVLKSDKGGTSSFNVDRLFDARHDQELIFNEVLAPMIINNSFKGFNCSLFSYGQTGYISLYY